MKYRPHKWLMLKIQNKGKTHYRIFGSWSGNFLSGDEWRMNSGIVSCREFSDYVDYFVFEGSSGSEYLCVKDMYGANAYGWGVANQYVEQSDGKLTLMTEEEALEQIKLGVWE